MTNNVYDQEKEVKYSLFKKKNKQTWSHFTLGANLTINYDFCILLTAK